jgi:enoyl-CoA hydratase/carnithine racemase
MEERLSLDTPVVSSDAELLTEVRNGVATVTLNRPAALNALTLGMLNGLTECMAGWAKDNRVKIVVIRAAGDKAFCAGGDVRALYEGFKAGRSDLLDFFVIEYALDYHIHMSAKPVVAVMDGIVMGGGMGLGQGAALRIVGDRTRMAMPETTIGLFPDVGGSYFLSRTPGKLGNYLGLVGPTLRAADAIYAKLADAYFSPDALATLHAELETAARSADPRGTIKNITQRRSSKPPTPAELLPLRTAIDTHFGRVDVGGIVRSLEAITDPALYEWRDKTLAALEKRSPTMLAVTLEQIARGKEMNLADVFRMELGMVQAALEHGDFIEGIRALLIDKDNAPKWTPPGISQIKAAAVARFFERRWPADQHPLKDLS